MAVLLMVEAKKGMSANQMKRTLGISYKTAWYLCHRIRKAMAETHTPLHGIVEADETYVGGKSRNMHKADRARKISGTGGSGKTIVAGVIQRGGSIRLKVVKNTGRQTLHAFLGENVHPDAEAIYTDSWPAYRGVGDENTRHETVDHNADEWVRGQVHTNSAESVWSLLDRSIIGSYHHLSVKHLPAYLSELEWRFNNRENPYLFRDTLTRLVQAETLEYKVLVGA
jgi:transposase-like protein